MKPENKQLCIDVLPTEPVQTAEMMKGDVPNNAYSLSCYKSNHVAFQANAEAVSQ